MLARYGEDGRLYAGGTELLLAMKHDLLRYGHLIDIKAVPGLDEIKLDGSRVTIGCTATHRAIERSPLIQQRIPVLAEVASRVANVRVRNTGTLGGNLCFAEPHSDPATLLLVLEARVRVRSATTERTLSIDDLVVGPYETSLHQDEVLTSVEVPLPPAGQRAAYLKFQVRERPTLGLAVLLEVNEDVSAITAARVAVGSVSPVPRRSSKAEALLVGPRTAVEGQLAAAGEALADEAELVDDAEGGADYKRHLIGVLLRRAFVRATNQPSTGGRR